MFPVQLRNSLSYDLLHVVGRNSNKAYTLSCFFERSDYSVQRETCGLLLHHTLEVTLVRRAVSQAVVLGSDLTLDRRFDLWREENCFGTSSMEFINIVRTHKRFYRFLAFLGPEHFYSY